MAGEFAGGSLGGSEEIPQRHERVLGFLGQGLDEVGRGSTQSAGRGGGGAEDGTGFSDGGVLLATDEGEQAAEKGESAVHTVIFVWAQVRLVVKFAAIKEISDIGTICL